MSSMAKVTNREVVAQGNFLQLEKVYFVDERNRERCWEGVSRRNTFGAVVILARCVPSDRILLVRQFRPPAGCRLLEFPAGLIDPGEGAAESAVRELYEETGYSGTIDRIWPPAYNSPGMSGETITIVEMTVNDADFPEEPETHQEDTECIEVFAVPLSRLADFVEENHRQGVGIDGKIITLLLSEAWKE